MPARVIPGYPLIQTVGGSVVAVVAYLSRPDVNVAIAVGNFILIDIVTGILRSGAEKRWDSGIARRGLMKKAGMVVALYFAHALDHMLGSQEKTPLMMAMAFGVIWSESVSILENLVALGIKVPPSLSRMLRDKADETGVGGNGEAK